MQNGNGDSAHQRKYCAAQIADAMRGIRLSKIEKEKIASRVTDWVFSRKDVVTGHTSGNLIAISARRVFEQVYDLHKLEGIRSAELPQLLDDLYKNGSPNSFRSSGGVPAQSSGGRYKE